MTNDLNDPDFLVTPEQELKVLNNIVKLVPIPGLGLSIGKQFHVGIIGKLGSAAINCNTLLDAFKLIYKYSDLLQTFYHYDFTIKDDLAFVRLIELVDLADVNIFMCERELTSIIRITRDLLGSPNSNLREIRFAYPQPAHVALYRNFFQCPLIFNAENHMITCGKKVLFQPLPLANPLLKKAYEKECQQLYSRIRKQSTITKRINQEIIFRNDNLPSYNQVARSMNLSPRTLRRRLAKEGTSFKNIIATVRKNKAINLIKTTDYSIAQIAMEVGYSDLANFYRAFKGWTGHAPSYYRNRKCD